MIVSALAPCRPPSPIVIKSVQVVTKVSTRSESRSDESHSGLQVPTSGHRNQLKIVAVFTFAGFLVRGRNKISQFRQLVEQDAVCVAGDEGGGAGATCLGAILRAVAERRSDNPTFLLAGLPPITDQSLARQD